MPSERQIPNESFSFRKKKIQYFEKCKRTESLKKKKKAIFLLGIVVSPVIKSKF